MRKSKNKSKNRYWATKYPDKKIGLKLSTNEIVALCSVIEWFYKQFSYAAFSICDWDDLTSARDELRRHKHV